MKKLIGIIAFWLFAFMLLNLTVGDYVELAEGDNIAMTYTRQYVFPNWKQEIVVWIRFFKGTIFGPEAGHWEWCDVIKDWIIPYDDVKWAK